MRCRSCESKNIDLFLSLGKSPLSNSILRKEDLNKKEAFFPLDVYLCTDCLLVQLLEYETPDNIFTDYCYFSSYSSSWLEHAKKYAIEMVESYDLDEASFVVEIASNDGYLLKNFNDMSIPNIGIEPANNVAEFARKNGINTICEFFGSNFSRELSKKCKADLIIANNVLAHVPDINDFVKGLKILLNKKGVITVEFPHLYELVKNIQFDTIYHEHFSYLSLLSLIPVFKRYELEIIKVDKLETHGGSLRLHVGHSGIFSINDSFYSVLNQEKEIGLDKKITYEDFTKNVLSLKQKILSSFIELKRSGKKIIGYGAAAKGNTLLNFCGIRSDFIDFIVDKNVNKQGKYSPGANILICDEDKIKEHKPDYIVILPWNLKNEIVGQLNYIRDWGGKFITLIPDVKIF